MNKNNKEEILNTPHCKHFVVRKKRFCRMTVKSGLYYCGEHEPKNEKSEDLSDSRLRIPCPLDSKHTCFASKLAKHLKKCNAQKIITELYLKTNINVGEDQDISLNNNRHLSRISSNEILEVIKKVNKLYSVIQEAVTRKILYHEILIDEINKPEYGDTTKKHLIQTSSIIEHLSKANLLNKKTCYVEFGAGKGQLSFWLSKVIKSTENSSILLVERASLRHKMDNKLDKSENNIHRIRADIADLVLNEVDVVKQSEKVVGVTKHLCGEATDLALRCLINSMNQGTNIHGIVMAFCCHHRCQWPNYTGKEFFDIHQFSRADFDVICGLVSWATCGTGLSREARKNIEHNTQENQKNNETKVKNDEIGLSKKEKELVGAKCKLLIDYGRMFYLQKHNFSCSLYYYVEQNITLENVCIVAQKL